MARTKKKIKIEESSNADEVFQVEYFKKVRVNEDGKWRYLVKWFGYDDPAEDTWEPQKNIANCQRLLASFWAEIGVDNDDYYPGWEGVPSEKWIKKERAFFAANHKDKDRQRRLEAQREREIKEEKKREEKKRKQKSNLPSISRPPIVIKRPPGEQGSGGSGTTSKISKKAVVKKEKKSVSLSDSSDSDVPISTILKGKKKSVPDPESSSSETPLIARKRKRRSGKETKAKEPLFLPDEGESPAPSKNAAVSLFSSSSVEATTPVKEEQLPPKEASTTLLSHRPSSSEGPGNGISAPKASQVVAGHAPKKPALPRLQTQSRTSGPPSASSVGPSAVRSATSTPTLPKVKGIHLSLPKASPQTNFTQPVTNPESTGRGISTKQRLMQGALDMHVPSAKFAEAPRPLVSQKSLPWSGLNFKKNLTVKASQSTLAPDMKMKVSTQSPTDFRSSASSSGTPPVVGQPIDDNELAPSLSRKRNVQPQYQPSPSQESRPPSMHGTPILSPEEPVRQSISVAQSPADIETMSPALELPPSVSSSAINSQPTDEAEKFLSSISTELAVVSPKIRSSSVLQYFTKRQPPKEQAVWTGEVLLRSGSDDKIQTICVEGMLIPLDPSDRQVALGLGGMPLKVAMSYTDSKLSIESFFRTDLLDSILSAFNPVQEWGWLCAEKGEEMNNLSKFAEFLLGQRLFGTVPILVEGKPVALLVLYPSAFDHDRLPRAISYSNNLTINVALYSWTLGADDRVRENARKHHFDLLDRAWLRRDPKLPQEMYEVYGGSGVNTVEGFKVMAKHAVRMLELPEMLHSYLLSDSERPFALWPPRDSESFQLSKTSFIETATLAAILKEYPKSKNRGIVGAEQDLSLRLIFLQVNSFSAGSRSGNVRDLPGLAKYRSSNDVRFFVYGSSDVVNPRFSNIMEEIWHIGGLATFTPSAILKDPLQTYQKIHQIEKHEFWACFILPAAIGMAISIAYRDRMDVVSRRIACPAVKHTFRNAYPGEDKMAVGDDRMEIDDESQMQIADDRMEVDDEFICPASPLCRCEGKFAHEWLLQAIEDDWVSMVGALPFPASDTHSSWGALHKGVIRDAKPRRKDEWEKYSADLLASSSSSSVPPGFKESHYKNDALEKWVSELFDSDLRDRSRTLAYCIDEFERLCRGLPEHEWEERVRREIIVELDRFQVSRPFRESFRRFVVVSGDEDEYSGSDKNGFEWVTTETFRFHDGTDEVDVLAEEL